MKISVALCTYNGEDFLLEQLESIYNQVMPVDEIVIFDDNSQDKTLTIAYQFQVNHPEMNLKIHKNDTNKGVLNNFENAINSCQGDIIFCCDQDDIWMKEKTKEIVSWFNTHPETEFIFTNAKLIDKNGQLLSKSTLFDKVQFTPKARKLWEYGLSLEITNIRNRVTGATMAFRRSIIKHIIPFVRNTHYLHDEQAVITCIKRGSVHMMDKCLILYRIHGKNTIGVNIKGDRIPPKLYRPYEVRKAIEMIGDHTIELKKRIDFLKERNKNCKTVKGRLKTIISLPKYINFYKRYFLNFYFTDLIDGLDDFIKNKFNIIRSKIKH